MTSPQSPADATASTRSDAYPVAEWRLLVDDAPHDGAWNMALDEALMTLVAEGVVPACAAALPVEPSVSFAWPPPAARERGY